MHDTGASQPMTSGTTGTMQVQNTFRQLSGLALRVFHRSQNGGSTHQYQSLKRRLSVYSKMPIPWPFSTASLRIASAVSLSKW